MAAYGLGGSSLTLGFLVVHQALLGYEDWLALKQKKVKSFWKKLFNPMQLPHNRSEGPLLLVSTVLRCLEESPLRLLHWEKPGWKCFPPSPFSSSSSFSLSLVHNIQSAEEFHRNFWLVVWSWEVVESVDLSFLSRLLLSHFDIQSPLLWLFLCGIYALQSFLCCIDQNSFCLALSLALVLVLSG